jgi:aerobic-type carbon monoxide dehydrogenase small subunit (CoxS/CutS family)
MAMISFTINGEARTVDVDPDMKLLWVIRDVLNLTGTKYSCGMSLCGACTVHLDGKPIRSCSTTVSRVAGRSITTIEGLAADADNPLIQAWIEEEVAQCGYCQSGQIMIATDLLANNPKPTDADIDKTMSRALCRCGTYQRIRQAIHRAAGEV